jgi:hypothetical protein
MDDRVARGNRWSVSLLLVGPAIGRSDRLHVWGNINSYFIFRVVAASSSPFWDNPGFKAVVCRAAIWPTARFLWHCRVRFLAIGISDAKISLCHVEPFGFAQDKLRETSLICARFRNDQRFFASLRMTL